MARVITPEAAHAAGTSAATLREVAAWNARIADIAKRPATRDQEAAKRCGAQAAALLAVADEVERLANRKSRRRAA